MSAWKGPVVALLVAGIFWQFGPKVEVCAVPQAIVDPPPVPVRDVSRLQIHGLDQGQNANSAPDPFALAQVPTQSLGPAIAAGPVEQPPARPWTLTGLVGKRAAVLSRPDGSSTVVSLGQKIDSATIVGISQAGVELEDRGGRFLLKVK